MSRENREDSQASPEYWASLESRQAVSEVSSEFRFGALEPPSDVTRRSVLKLLGASAALAGTTACRPVENIVPYVDYPEGMIPGIPQRYATTLVRGIEAHGVVVESHEGRPTKIEGNELHPNSLGSASAQMQSTILELYDPDRQVGFLHGEESASRDDFLSAWGSIASGLSSDGSGLAVLAEGSSSPTFAALAASFRARYPAARWVHWDAIGDANALTAVEGHRSVLHLDRARVVLALDCDLLHSESGALRNARGWSGLRANPAESMNRLYAVESTVTVTGATADHRIPLQSRRIGDFLGALGLELGVPGAVAGQLSEELLKSVRVIAADLKASGAESLVAVGRNQPPSVHALALEVNRLLGSVGTTVTYHAGADLGWGADSDLVDLVQAMGSGEVGTLVVMGGNPVHTAPGELEFATALEAVENSIHLGSYRDETSRRCDWHLPLAHALESWGDARDAGGTVSVVQPLIEPLHGGVSALELTGLLSSGAWRAGAEWVREHWSAEFGADDSSWNQILHDGVLVGSELPAVEPPALEAPLEVESIDAEGLELVWLASSTVWDGRFANSAWLQEAPDPLSKLSWDNAALVAPKTAEKLVLATQDALTLKRGGREVTLSVVVLPGQAENSIAVDLGYGRAAAGRIGNGVGVNISPLRKAGNAGFAGGLEAVQVAGTNKLVFSQEEWDLHDRPLVREADQEEFLHHPEFAQEPDAELVFHELFPRHEYTEGPQWGMTIDLNACTGCMACVTACQSENNIPVVGKNEIDRGREMLWLRVDRYFKGDPGNPSVVFQPVPCMHCENAPCEQVCPVEATVHNPEGLNLMVYNRCIGTRYCSNNCPYKVRRFNFYNFTKDTPELTKMAMNPAVTVRSRGVMEKCTYCIQRIAVGKHSAKSEGRALADGEIRTACQQTCPTQAIAFGDLLAEDSEVARNKRSPRNYTLLAELANFPRTTYLARIRNPNPAWEQA